MDRNTQRKGLVNLLALLVLGGAVFVAGSYANSLSGHVASIFFAIGVLIAFVSWFQMRLESREAAEKMEIDEMARTKSGSTLFEAKDAAFLPAASSRKQFEKYFVTGFMVVLLAAMSAGGFALWRWLDKVDYEGITSARAMVSMGMFAGIALVLFMIGRFMVTIARLDNNRLLRPASNFVLLGSYLTILCAAATLGDKIDFPKADLYLAKAFVILLALVVAETFITLLFEIYRPRLKGKIARPLYDSRVVGLLAQPEGLVATAAQTLDYQFGFKVSETWFFRIVRERILQVFLVQLALLILSTCVVFIEPGEQALLERSGKPVTGRAVLNPGAHLKLPWPVDKVYRYRTEQIQTLSVGFTPEKEEHEEKLVLWTVAHTKEENFLVANRDQAANEFDSGSGAKKSPPVSLITVSIPVQFQITNLVDWVYNHENSQELLQQLATREVVRFLVSADINNILSVGRLESAQALEQRIQAAANAQKLGARILFVGLHDLHPPVKVAPEYEKVVAAIQKRQATIIRAEGDAIRTNNLASAQALSVTNLAEAARIKLELTASARAAAFTNQIPAFNAAPSVYAQRLYAQTFPRATAGARKYILVTTNTQNVITFDLQHNATDDFIRQQAEAINKPN
jgi:regulator of protease activity HflC (stomatin/prohibitin superfamily)